MKAARRVARSFPELPVEDAAPIAAPNADPSRESQRAEDAARIRQAVAALPDEHRQVIELRFFADATLDDIAATLDIPLGTVKSRLHNGLEKLRQQKLAVNLFSMARESPTRQP